jgi:hypothetical protein
MFCKESIMTYLLFAGIVLVTGLAFTWLLLQAATVSALHSASWMTDDELAVLPVVEAELSGRHAPERSRRTGSALSVRIATPGSPVAAQA